MLIYIIYILVILILVFVSILAINAINRGIKSKNYLKVYKYKLNKNSILFVPKGFAHGYFAICFYKL